MIHNNIYPYDKNISIDYDFKEGNKKKDKEIQTYIQVNTNCNQKCVFCNRPPTDSYRGQIISMEKIKRKIDDLSKDWNIKRIIFTGGEPTLHNKLPEIIQYAKRYGFITEIQTNGTLLNKEMLKNLKSHGLDIINFAFHSHIKSISNKLRGVNFGYETIINNIKDADKIGFEIHIIHVINSLNYKNLLRLIYSITD